MRVPGLPSALQALGATEAERKRFTATIAEAGRHSTDENAGPEALEEARETLKDLTGAYRSAASLVVQGIDGRDPKIEQALRMKGGFPNTDLLLAGFLRGLATRMKSFSAKLATRGFSKEKQAQLVDAGAAFKLAVAARGKERGEARSQTLARETLFKSLRTETSYFRKLGHEAMRSAVQRADFDRVALPAVKTAAAPAPTQAPSSAAEQKA